MASLTQSAATTATTAPSYYTDYLTNLASKGTAAGAAVSPTAWDPNANQTAAFTNVGANVGNYQPGLTQAGESFGKAGATDITGATQPYLTAGTTTSGLSAANPYLTSGTSSSADLVGNYMNPYTQNVVDQIRLANQQNIQQNLSPGITAGAVGGGQFGSKRGAEALALGISNANLGALGQQATALQTGYADAMKQAAQQRLNQLEAGKTAGTLQNAANANQVTAGQVAGNMATQQGQLYRDVGTAEAGLAAQQQKQGLADVEALANVGAQQQTLAQNKQLMPLDVLGKQASIMSGAQLPMTTTQTMTGSPLSMIAGLGSLGLGAFASKDGKSPVDNIAAFLKGFGSGSGSGPALGTGSSGSSASGVGNPGEADFGNYYPSDFGNAYDQYLANDSGYGVPDSEWWT